MILSLRKAFAFGAAVVLLAALSVYGMNLLAGKSTTVTPPIVSVTTVRPLELKLELQKTEFVQGEPVNITVSLRNIGNTTLAISLPKILGRVKYVVYDANNTQVNADPTVLPAIVDRFYLEPNEQVSRTFTWDQIAHWPDSYNLKFYWEMRERQVPKGTYSIVGKTQGIALGNEVAFGELETAAITITIN